MEFAYPPYSTMPGASVSGAVLGALPNHNAAFAPDAAFYNMYDMATTFPWDQQYIPFDTSLATQGPVQACPPTASDYSYPLTNYNNNNNSTSPSVATFTPSTISTPYRPKDNGDSPLTASPPQVASLSPQAPEFDEQRTRKRRKRSSRSETASKPATRRSSKANQATVETKGSRRRQTSTDKAPSPSSYDGVSPSQHDEEQVKKIQERNRIASNKFRVKKKQDAHRLRGDEEDMSRINHELTNCVTALTLEVYELKMKLLQHTECKCVLIQDYIAHEAKRYIANIDNEPSGSHTSPVAHEH